MARRGHRDGHRGSLRSPRCFSLLSWRCAVARRPRGLNVRSTPSRGASRSLTVGAVLRALGWGDGAAFLVLGEALVDLGAALGRHARMRSSCGLPAGRRFGRSIYGAIARCCRSDSRCALDRRPLSIAGVDARYPVETGDGLRRPTPAPGAGEPRRGDAPSRALRPPIARDRGHRERSSFLASRRSGGAHPRASHAGDSIERGRAWRRANASSLNAPRRRPRAAGVQRRANRRTVDEPTTCARSSEAWLQCAVMGTPGIVAHAGADTIVARQEGDRWSMSSRHGKARSLFGSPTEKYPAHHCPSSRSSTSTDSRSHLAGARQRASSPRGESAHRRRHRRFWPRVRGIRIHRQFGRRRNFKFASGTIGAVQPEARTPRSTRHSRSIRSDSSRATSSIFVRWRATRTTSPAPASAYRRRARFASRAATSTTPSLWMRRPRRMRRRTSSANEC